MSICMHGRSVGSCPLCPVAPPFAPLKVGDKVELQTITTVGASTHQETKLVRIPDEITDPAAKTMLELAQTYAQAQDNLAAITATVRNTESLLRTARRDQVEAEKKCRAAQAALHAAVAPKVARKKSKAVTEIAKELEVVEEQKA